MMIIQYANLRLPSHSSGNRRVLRSDQHMIEKTDAGINLINAGFIQQAEL